MRSAFDRKARKRPVNLTLNEDLVTRARELTGNLSEVVESLLAEFVTRERSRQATRAAQAQAAARQWNEFAERHGSFADEHSTL